MNLSLIVATNKEGLAYFCRYKDSIKNSESENPIKQYGYIGISGKEVNLV